MTCPFDLYNGAQLRVPLLLRAHTRSSLSSMGQMQSWGPCSNQGEVDCVQLGSSLTSNKHRYLSGSAVTFWTYSSQQESPILLQVLDNTTGNGVNLHLACSSPFQNNMPVILKQITRNASKNMTLVKSSADSTNAPMIFLKPGNFDTDLNGLSTRKLLSADRLGNIGITETTL